MNTIFFPEIKDNKSKEDSPTNHVKNNNNNSSLKNDPNSNNSNSFEPFKAFSSALFMSEYPEKEDTKISSSSNSTSNKEQKNKNYLDLNISPSLEKCLTNELLESMADDSSNYKLRKNSINNNINNQNENEQNLKITKKLFGNKHNKENKEKEGNTLYEENINGFEYQLKFIENSVHNILPKSYKKFSYKNNYNYYYNKNNYNYNNHRTSFPYSNNNKYRNNYYSNNKNDFPNGKNKTSTVNVFFPNLINKDNNDKNDNNYCSNNTDVKNKILFQIQNMKSNENDYNDWVCSDCTFVNRGYRKICAKCNMYRKK